MKTAKTKQKKTEAVIAFKGFNQDWTCRGFQYKAGETYQHQGNVRACDGGFHACEHPLDVFSYYPPATSRYAEVELSGAMHRDGSGTKIAAAEITIKAELKIPDIIARAVQYVMDRAKPEGEGSHATGYSGAASATGDSGAASATGVSGAASATGVRGAASATGDSGAASATGVRGAASATGDSGAAMASGFDGRVMGADGNALFLVERLNDWKNPEHGKIIAVWAGIAGRDGIKADTWYSLKNGKPVEV